jgi:diadenosine tetraphosphate (Ap4A) HIT family hydrolase
MECVFCKIIRGEMATKKIAETDSLIVIQDIFPKAPIHYLIIPKKHIQDVQNLSQQDLSIAADIFAMAQQLSQTTVDARDFKLHVNSGKNAGQIVMHLHVHFTAGKLTGSL